MLFDEFKSMYEKEIKKFNNLIEKVDIVSFDIFDTLLIRPYLSPQDLFEHIEKLYKLNGFKKERILAEKRSRYIHATDEDITIDDIYENICPEYSNLKNIEMEFEKQVLIPNPFIKYFYDKANSSGKTIIAISDMYLPSEFLKIILHKNGFTNIKAVYVSGEYKKSKGSKHLYEEVVKKIGVEAKKILHIGDNLQSDYFSAMDSGINAIFLEKYIDKFYKTQSGKKYAFLSKKNDSLDFSIITSLSAIQLLQNSNNYWYDLGYNFGGPFAIGYTQYIIEQCKLNNINNLLFVSRDGYILQKIYKILTGENALENHYIYAPRILNIKCFLDYRNNFTYLKNIFDINKDICPDFNTIPETFEQAKQLFNNNIAELHHRAENEYNEYKQYLAQLDIKNSRMATIDMTTGAFSSQAFLTNIFKDKIVLGLFSGTFCENTEFKYKTFANKNFIPEDIPKINILELLFTAPELSLESIKNSKPVYKTPTKEDLFRLNIYPYIEQGILDFVKTYKDVFGKCAINFKSDVCFELFNVVTALHSKTDKHYLKSVCHSKDINNKKFQAIYSDLKFPVVIKRKIKNFIIKIKQQSRVILRDKYRLVKFYLYEARNV